MATGYFGAALRQLDRLFGAGTVAGLGEDQLLDRFVARRDEAAFEALVAQHGPMVLGVCRRWLDDPHDVDDAFQATFLVLVRRAGTLRRGGPLGPWLYGVARRVAARARARSARRRSRERRQAEEVAVTTAPEFDRQELRSALDEELDRLPEKYRAPVVLCYLEGLTHEEAASRLRCPVGTVRSRMAWARRRLRERLTRRGLALSAGLLGEALAAEPVPAALLEATVKAAMGVAAGKAVAAGVVSASVVALARGVSKTMFLSIWTKFLAAGGVAVAILGGVGAFSQQESAGDGQEPAAKGAPAREEDDPARLAERLRQLQNEVNRYRALQMQLEAQIEDLKQQLNAAQPKAMGKVTAHGRDSRGFREKASGETPKQLATPQPKSAGRRGGYGAMMPGGGSSAMMPGGGYGAMGMMGGGMMGGGMMGGMGEGPPDSKIFRASNQSMIAVAAPDKDGIAVYSIDSGHWAKYKVPSGVKATPVLSLNSNITAVMLEGPEI